MLANSFVAPPKSSPEGRTLKKRGAKVSPTGGDLEGAYLSGLTQINQPI